MAKAYYEHHGDLDIPSTFKTINGYEEVKETKGTEKVFDLGRWISKQRYGNIENEVYNLSDIQRELLNNIEMIWDLNEYRWNKRYNLAKAYYEHHGHLDIPSTFKTINGYEEVQNGEFGIPLGQWILNQRAAYNRIKFSRLDKERIEKLNAIEMVWDTNEYRWDKRYNLVKVYYEHYGNLDIKVRFKTKNGYEEDEKGDNIGQWMDTQIRKYRGNIKGILTDEQLSLLEILEICWFKENDERYQKELITSNNKHKKQIEIYNRFRTYLNKISDDINMPTKEEMSQGWINQLDKIDKEKDKPKVTSLEEAIDETIKDYGYDKLTDRVKQLIYCIILHIESMDQDEYAYKAFTEENGARDYIKSKGKKELIEEIKQSLNLNNEIIDNETNIYQQYANNYYDKKCNKEKVTSLEEAINETIKDYEYEKNSDRIELLIYCIISHIDRMDQYEDAYLAFTEKNGARDYIKSKGKKELIEEIKQSLNLNNENIDNETNIYQQYANDYYIKKYSKELPLKKKF